MDGILDIYKKTTLFDRLFWTQMRRHCLYCILASHGASYSNSKVLEASVLRLVSLIPSDDAKNRAPPQLTLVRISVHFQFEAASTLALNSLAILQKSLDRAISLHIFIREARLSCVRAFIIIVRIRKFCKIYIMNQRSTQILFRIAKKSIASLNDNSLIDQR